MSTDSSDCVPHRLANANFLHARRNRKQSPQDLVIALSPSFPVHYPRQIQHHHATVDLRLPQGSRV
jgi:hypothetical protein